MMDEVAVGIVVADELDEVSTLALGKDSMLFPPTTSIVIPPILVGCRVCLADELFAHTAYIAIRSPRLKLVGVASR